MFSTQAVSPPRPQKARQQPRSRRARRGAAVLTALGLSLSPLLAGSLPAGAVPAAAVPATNAQAEAEILEIQRFAGEADAKLGSGVAIAGDYVAYTEVLGKSVTFAHLADPVTNTWERTTIAEDELTTGYYGEAIALTPDASRAYVSAPGNPEIFVYARSGSNDWTRDGVLTAPDAEVLVADYGYSMGSSLALEGNRLVVGVPKAEVDEVGWAGLALVVDVTTDEWTTLLPPEPLPFDMAGEKVAISGNLVAAGAPGALHTDEDLTGGVYVWDLSDPSLTPTVLRPTPPESQTCSARLEFGSSVAFNDGTLYVGAPLAGERLTPAGCEAEYDEPGTVDQGAIYRYDRALQQVGGPLLPAPGFGALGGSLAVAGDMLLASSTLPSTGLGQVQVLDRRDFTDEPGSAEPQVATPVQLLTPSSPTAGADFGNQHRGNGIATDGGRAFVGAPREGEGAEQTSDGAAYVFEPALPPRPAVSLTLEASEATIEYGDRTSLTATLSGPQELPEGTVTGSVAGFALDPAALTEGTAALRTPEERISVGSHTVELAFTPAGADVPAAHTQATLTVTPVDTTTLLKVTYEITAVPGAPAAGDTPSSAADPLSLIHI